KRQEEAGDAAESPALDKIIQLAEHRAAAPERQPSGNDQPAVNEKTLTSGERLAFQQIAERLKKESGHRAEDAGVEDPEGREGPEGRAQGHQPPEDAEEIETIAELQALDGANDSAVFAVGTGGTTAQ